MTVNEMAAVIVSKYGTTIRGRRVIDMSDRQIIAIYHSIRQREEKMSEPHHTEAARCISCSWYGDHVCNKYGFKTNETTLACSNGYVDKTELHQLNIFEIGGNKEGN